MANSGSDKRNASGNDQGKSGDMTKQAGTGAKSRDEKSSAGAAKNDKHSQDGKMGQKHS
ncbi:hypothetical protein [Devosia sp. MC521]|uniref:hypothetical protein n=1 Tax=Devosia sp. MC521 TaxID=2759954 RepID=UPI0015FB0907|nr:hypothetical protein [Devosia sp. MC521]MBJ6986926.1 hypothetical protein [Devosia sp. MC521]QMW63950.1 hypothetical protein H4N61_06440 [Devosia sp. MC521]